MMLSYCLCDLSLNLQISENVFFRSLFKKKKSQHLHPLRLRMSTIHLSLSICDSMWVDDVLHCPPLCSYWVSPLYLLFLPRVTILCFACILCCLVFCCFRHSCFRAWLFSGPRLWFCIMGLVWMFCPNNLNNLWLLSAFYIIDFCSEPCCMWRQLLGQNLLFPVCFD